MVRITKDREERRTEILDVAQELFLTNGYVRTTVSDIVKKMGVAQGTIYHYFKSKDDILDAILERCTEQIAMNVEQIENEPGLTAVEKLQQLIDFTLKFDGWSSEMIEYVHLEENILLHHMLEMRSSKSLVPIVARMIRSGVKEGVFSIPYSEEAAMLIVVGIGGMYDTLKGISYGSYVEKLEAIEELLERILGSEKGSFNLRENE